MDYKRICQTVFFVIIALLSLWVWNNLVREGMDPAPIVKQTTAASSSTSSSSLTSANTARYPCGQNCGENERCITVGSESGVSGYCCKGIAEVNAIIATGENPTCSAHSISSPPAAIEGAKRGAAIN